MQPIYLDYNATTPIRPEVLDAMLPCLRTHFGNPSSLHRVGRRAKQALEEAREQEMTRWTDANPQELAEELRQRGERWRELLIALPDSAFATPAVVWWMGGTLGDAVASWRGHDRQHGEDLRLALAQGSTLVE